MYYYNLVIVVPFIWFFFLLLAFRLEMWLYLTKRKVWRGSVVKLSWKMMIASLHQKSRKKIQHNSPAAVGCFWTNVFDWEGVQGWNRHKGHAISLLPLFLRLFSYVVYFDIFPRMLYIVYCIFFPSKSTIYYNQLNGKKGGLGRYFNRCHFLCWWLHQLVA